MKLKQIIASVLCGIMVSSAVPAFAEDDIKVFVDGEQLYFEVQPIILDGYTMVPMRAIFEKLGYTVEWYQEAQMIEAINRKTDKDMILYIGDPGMILASANEIDGYTYSLDDFINSHYHAIDMAPIIIDGNTLVPVRAIAEASGCSVFWDNENRSVNIFTEELVGIPIEDMNQMKYYPGTRVPDIESVTKISLQMVKSLYNPFLGYDNLGYYYYFNYDAILEYDDFLLDHGFYLDKKSSGDGYTAYIYRRYDDYNCVVMLELFDGAYNFAIAPINFNNH